MSDASRQDFSSHARWVPSYHFFALPVVFIYALFQVYVALRNPGKDTILQALFAVAVATAITVLRVMSNRVQDRVIRLEETLRMQRVLPASMQGQIGKLSRPQFVALRFAPDEELPELVQRTVTGEFPDQKAIKQAIKQWRADHMRA